MVVTDKNDSAFKVAVGKASWKCFACSKKSLSLYIYAGYSAKGIVLCKECAMVLARQILQDVVTEDMGMKDNKFVSLKSILK